MKETKFSEEPQSVAVCQADTEIRTGRYHRLADVSLEPLLMAPEQLCERDGDGLLPLSWSRIHGIRPNYHGITLPLTRTPWITCADIPDDYSFPILYEDLTASFPGGYLFRGCTPAMGSYFVARNCSTIRTGAEAVLDLRGQHFERKTVQAALIRGRRHGTVAEIFLNEPNQRLFEKFRHETTHAAKPQLQHLFREMPSMASRCFVFRAFSGDWLGALTLSRRGQSELHTELMLRHRSAPGDIMECLVTGVFEILSSEGYREWSLGEVPFFTLKEIPEHQLTSIEKVMLSLMSHSTHAYDFEGLYRFKNKFLPQWRPVMLCSSSNPSAIMLTELAIAMGFTDLLVHESLGLFKERVIPF